MTLLLVHAASTWFMVGLIWMVQVVHYPLFSAVGVESFAGYESGHTARIGRLLVVPATVEVMTGGLLVWARPEGVALGLVLLAGSLLAAIWIMTALVQAPQHGRLTSRFDAAEIADLVRSNWWRTGAWSVRGVLVGAMVFAAA